MNIILLAAPAAGKGTQAEILKSVYNLNHISTGNLLREYSRGESDFNKKIKEILESGNLVSDDIVLEVLNRHLASTSNMNLLFDGFPRNIFQAKELDGILEEKNNKIDYVFLLNNDKDILLKRITGRRLCKGCGAIYNVNIDPLKPKNELICDKCGSSLFTRSDDNEESFNVRYREYLEQTYPLIDYYKNKGILYEIDSSIGKEETFKQIEEILGKR